MDFLVSFHSIWRWAVLVAGVVAIVAAVAGWVGVLPPGIAARRSGLLYTTAIDVQFLVGAILWVGKGWYATPGYFRFEHPTIMLLALVVAHGGQALARRSKGGGTAMARTVTVATAISLLLVIVGIPGVVRQV